MLPESGLSEPFNANIDWSAVLMTAHKSQTPVEGTPQYNRSLKSYGAVCRETEALSNTCQDELESPAGFVNDTQLASRKATVSAERRYQAADWLQHMVGPLDLSTEPSEEDFRSCLQNGIVLCNLINKVNPGAVLKIVDHSAVSAPAEGVALTAFQYFENVRNFVVAVEDLKLPSFDASDLEKGGSQMGGSSKVVDCILSVKAYFEWQQAGRQGNWKLGGTLKTPGSTKTPISRPRLACAWLGSGKSPNVICLSSSKSRAFVDSIEPACGNSDFCVAWMEEVCTKFVEAFLAKNRCSDRMPMLATSDTDMPGEALLNMVLAVLHDKNPDEVAMLVECMLKKVLEKYRQQAMCLERQRIVKASGADGICGHNLEVQKNELKEVKNALETTAVQFQTFKFAWEKEMDALGVQMHELSQATAEYHKVAAENRELYNQVQDLKGSIRVYCRVRPFLPNQSSTKSTVEFSGGKGSLVIANPLKQGKEHRKMFAFNKVFGPSATQEEVFLDTQPLIRSVLDGYNVCIFAYGQTGSGKTYTMMGPNNATAADWGVNFRALHDLFKISQNRKDVINYEVTVQMMEIYNEQVRDLLCIDGGIIKKLEIRNSSQQNGLNVPDASLLPVNSIENVLELMNLGQKNRAVGCTAMNERSSRSHSVLTVHVKGTEIASRDTLRGCLHLVDLAGSERVDKSEVTGDRLKEAQHINKSLSALGDVIAALAQKSTHIPYRNSKLTQLLQDSLGGQAKTLMFVHVSSDEDSYGETMSTLKFAERVATVELGAAHSNKETAEIKDLRDQIILLREALSKKDLELERCQKELRTKNLDLLQESKRMKSALSPIHLGTQLGIGDLRSPLEEVGNMENRQSPVIMQKFTPTTGLRKVSFGYRDSPLGLSRSEDDCLKRRAYQNAPSVNAEMVSIITGSHAGGNISGAKKAKGSQERDQDISMSSIKYRSIEIGTLDEHDSDMIRHPDPSSPQMLHHAPNIAICNPLPVPVALETADIVGEEEMEELNSTDNHVETDCKQAARLHRNSDIRSSTASFGKRRQKSSDRRLGGYQAGQVAKRPITVTSPEMGSLTAETTRNPGRQVLSCKIMKATKKGI